MAHVQIKQLLRWIRNKARSAGRDDSGRDFEYRQFKTPTNGVETPVFT
jgi:hypothetical protein